MAATLRTVELPRAQRVTMDRDCHVATCCAPICVEAVKNIIPVALIFHSHRFCEILTFCVMYARSRCV